MAAFLFCSMGVARREPKAGLNEPQPSGGAATSWFPAHGRDPSFLGIDPHLNLGKAGIG